MGQILFFWNYEIRTTEWVRIQPKLVVPIVFTIPHLPVVQNEAFVSNPGSPPFSAYYYIVSVYTNRAQFLANYVMGKVLIKSGNW